MLKLFPIVGTILLTVIIAYGLYRGWRNSRGRIVDALHGRPALNPVEALIKAGVLDEDDPRVQAWRDYCDEPVGDPPASIPFADGGLVRSPTGRFVGELSPEFILPNAASKAPRPAASEPESRPSLSWDSGSPRNSMGAAIRRAIMPEVTSPCTCDPDDRPPVCPRKYAVSDCVAAYRAAYPEIAEIWSDEGEPLLSPPQPNIGGLGNPPYAGPHYDTVKQDRFVPYDVIGEPIPGTAVHLVGNAGAFGPIPEHKEDPNHHPVQQYREDDK